MTAVMSPITSIGQLLRLLGGVGDSAIGVEIEGEPRSKARPRFSAGGKPYSDRKQVEHARYLGLRLRDGFPQPMEGNVVAIAIFYRSHRGRIDLDNLLKQALDAANGIVYEDDAQVTALAGRLELDRENPRTLLAFASHESTMQRGDRSC